MRVKLEDICKRIYAGGDVPKDRYSEVKTEEYSVPIYANAEKDDGLYGYTDKAREEELSITVAARGTIGFTAIRRTPFLPVVRLITVVPDIEKVSERYLYYALKNCKPQSSGTSIPQLTVPDIKKNSLELYDIPKQEIIADQLDKLNRIIELRRQELEVLDNLIKARFVEMFGSIHDGKFEMKTLPEIVSSDKNSIKRGPFGGALKKDDFVEEGYLVYEQRHAIHNDFEYAKYYITQEKYEDMIGFKVVPGDLIISCSGVTLGRIAEVPNGAKEGIINQALLKLSLNQELMMNTFFIQQFRGEEIQEILFGFSRGSGIPNMPSMSEVKAVKFVCPSLELQKQYCDFVHQVDKSKVAVQKALDETQLLFDSLMQRYFG